MTTPTIRAALERLVEIDRTQSIDWAWEHENAIAAARAALAEPVGEGARELQWPASVAQGCHEAAAEAESGSPLQQLLVVAGDLLERCHPTAPAAPEPPAEALAARPLLEQVARLGDCIGANTVGQIMAISNRAAAWLRDNPPGQPVALEPRGCPIPEACACVALAAEPVSEGPPAVTTSDLLHPAYEPGDGTLLEWLRLHPNDSPPWQVRASKRAELLAIADKLGGHQ